MNDMASALFGQLLPALPAMLVAVTGIVFALLRYASHPLASALLLAGCALHVVASLGDGICVAWLIVHASQDGGARMVPMLTLVGWIAACVNAIVFGLLIAAALSTASRRSA